MVKDVLNRKVLAAGILAASTTLGVSLVLQILQVEKQKASHCVIIY